ncbi:MAG: efflux RND transporter permease subunit [Bdellovibrionales bacterium]|nr:efflux RND transporter permease subunit [Bdellovibrionales bacterium]
MKLIRFFVERSFYVHLVTAAIVITGLMSLLSLKRDLSPPFEWNRISVSASIIGASPEEMEKFVTFPVEDVLKDMPGMERMSSSSGVGYSSIDLFFKADFDKMTEALDTVNSRLASIRNRLPDSLREIRAEQSKVTDTFLIWMGLENFDELNPEHRQFYEKFEEALLNIPGVTNAYSDFRKRNVHIRIDPIKLTRHEVSVDTVRNTLLAGLNIAPVGSLKVNYENRMVTIDRVATDLASIRALPLRANMAGYTLTVGDVADVRWELVDKESIYYVNGNPGLTLSLRKSLSTDAIDLKHDAWEVVQEMQAKAPAGVKVLNMVDGPQFIERQMGVLNQNGLIGLGLVFLMLMFFLNSRTALMATLGLPIAYFGTFTVLMLLGIDIDLISLVGLILVIGILVDDAIIVSEKYSDLLASGIEPNEAATKTVSELLVPVSGTVLTTMVAFAPVLFIKSEMSKMIYAIPVVVLSALALSWFESFFILPNHLAHFVKKPSGAREKWFQALKLRYEAMLYKGLKFRYLLMVLGAAMIGGAGWIASTQLKHNFNLNIFAERMAIYIELEETDSKEASAKKIEPIIEHLATLKDAGIENTFASVGKIWMNGKRHEGPQYARILAYLDREHPYPSELKEALKSKVDPFLEKVKSEGGYKKLYAEIQKANADEEADQMVSLIVEGGEDGEFADVIDEMEKLTADSKTFLPYERDEDRLHKTWRFVPSTAKLAQHGMTSQMLSSQMRSLFTEDEVVETRLQGEKVRVYTEIGEKDELSFEQLGALQIVNATGSSVPLRFLGKWEDRATLASISHSDGKRSLDMQVKVNQETGNMATAEKELSAIAVSLGEKYPQFEFKTEASNKKEQKSSQWALRVAAVCIFGVLFVIAFILGSVTQPIVVGLPIPFGLVGIIMALYVHDEPLGLMALIGLVSTVGVAVNASIVMVDQINKRAAELGGMTKEAIITGASSRLRAILLTTVTTVGGVFPMAYGIGGESGFTQPLAFAMGWGLTFSTIMTVFLVPSYLQIREDLSFVFGWLYSKVFGSEEVAPVAVTPAATFDAFETTFADDDDLGLGVSRDLNTSDEVDLPLFLRESFRPSDKQT